ncbi:NAD(P)/FAD-dependent oxidoreductase [Cryobacterium sp. TMT3-29-2]|uniref:flavin-containing monooxygenase n=1 Tax=Cryobacterium sp. TMT3-29-2 TaxID=2555867 RepID=UPI00107440F5|nr:NAD(P)-binding domain-containing protein [Cryobacterium sp. TMT3-29-2]TFC93250.1 portal protein [Cryobacterium sp. TMT3-29-2]
MQIARNISNGANRERVSVAVVGAGQAGLAISYHLQREGIDHVILDGANRIGQSWRTRWDSLRLFTPARHDGLPGLPFPAAAGYFPTKDEVADYLQTYADRFRLPLRLGARVDRLWSEGGSYILAAGSLTIEAKTVVAATGAYQMKQIPSWAPALDRSILQIHAADYRNPAQLPMGPVLVVGAGNSGVELALELARAGHPTQLAGNSTGHIPSAAYAFNGMLFWFLANRVLSIDTPVGRRLAPKSVAHGGPLIRRTLKAVQSAGVELVPRVSMALDGWPQLEDGRIVDVSTVIWCTGFGRDFSWIDLPGFKPAGLPEHDRGAVPSQPGLYFIGLPFQTRLASSFIGGVGDDAEALARTIAARLSEESPEKTLQGYPYGVLNARELPIAYG